MPRRRKTEYIQVRCTPRQKTAYEAAADARDKSVSEWLRALADRAVEEHERAQRRK